MKIGPITIIKTKRFDDIVERYKTLTREVVDKRKKQDLDNKVTHQLLEENLILKERLSKYEEIIEDPNSVLRKLVKK